MNADRPRDGAEPQVGRPVGPRSGPPSGPRSGSASGSAPGLDLVCFRWGGFDLALPTGAVLALDADADPAAPDIGALLGLDAPAGGPPGPVGRTRLLRLRGADPAQPGRRVRVAEPVRRLQVGAVQPVPPLLAARLRLRGLRALALTAPPTRLLLLVAIPDQC